MADDKDGANRGLLAANQLLSGKNLELGWDDVVASTHAFTVVNPCCSKHCSSRVKVSDGLSASRNINIEQIVMQWPAHVSFDF